MRKSAFTGIVIAMAGLLSGGCLMIPYGYSCEKESVVAKRENAAGKVEAQILHRKMHLEILILGLNPDGGLCNTSYFLYSRFAHVTDGKRSGIWSFGHFPMLVYDQWPNITSIPRTDCWAYATEKILSVDDVKLRLRIWSEGKGLVYDRTFKRVDRNTPWAMSDEPEWIRVNDRAGNVLINVLTGKERTL